MKIWIMIRFSPVIFTIHIRVPVLKVIWVMIISLTLPTNLWSFLISWENSIILILSIDGSTRWHHIDKRSLFIWIMSRRSIKISHWSLIMIFKTRIIWYWIIVCITLIVIIHIAWVTWYFFIHINNFISIVCMRLMNFDAFFHLTKNVGRWNIYKKIV